MSSTAPSDPVYRHALRELRGIVLIWSLTFVWVIGYCIWAGYGNEPDQAISLVAGMPAWVFWGIVVPWIAATIVTCWFALFRIADDRLTPSQPAASESESGTAPNLRESDKDD